ncbi:MAG: hypothetical protein EBS90_08895 [Betaproteobacteria bacterium]|nr:hypothetical protein [Betaproteobacteria bacterium]
MSVNRSEEIRRFFDQNPGARPKDCITALAAQGIDVSPTLVSCVRAKLKERAPQRDMAVDVALVRDFVDSSGLDPEVAVEILTRFVGVVEGVGGLVRFREVLLEIGPLPPGPGGGLDDDPEQLPVSVPVSVSVSTPALEPAFASGEGSSSAFSYDDVSDEEDDD